MERNCSKHRQAAAHQASYMFVQPAPAVQEQLHNLIVNILTAQRQMCFWLQPNPLCRVQSPPDVPTRPQGEVQHCHLSDAASSRPRFHWQL